MFSGRYNYLEERGTDCWFLCALQEVWYVALAGAKPGSEFGEFFQLIRFYDDGYREGGEFGVLSQQSFSDLVGVFYEGLICGALCFAEYRQHSKSLFREVLTVFGCVPWREFPT